ncbi:MAG: DUF5107 domain-containing protein [Kiritimatiellae bacterium]|nr:DUF5107 domain-containing protein [Kiritimatiellia bacterium]
MTELRLEPFVLPAADLGPENPLPVITDAVDLHARIKTAPSFHEEDKENLGWGFPPSILPYRFQDGFNRERRPRAFQAAVLENEHLKAVFLPELGGHLWSFVSKDSGEELLSSNPVFQPCNLALRKAWISGGIEWNFGWTGHWPLTCSPLFAARRTLPDGTPELRMWEFERVRRMPVQIDAWLPAGSKALYVRSSIHNANDHMTPVYWWTNIAAPQQEGTRVLVSADETILYDYLAGAMGACPLPTCGDELITYPGRMRGSRDFFFRVPASEEHPWEIALQPSGRGLFQTSTQRLRGRKLFRWGVQQGGRNWQRFLCTPDYIEIQAGLARTQSHHVPMPAGETWSWVEAFGEVAPGAGAFSDDWTVARAAGERAVRTLVPGDAIDALLADSASWACEPPRAEEIFLFGSGWGALEARRRPTGEPPFPGLPGVVFPTQSCGGDQAPWLALLEGGIFARRPLTDEPGAFGTVEYLAALEASFERPGGRNWLSLFHWGVLLWQDGKKAEAVAAWDASCAAEENGWSRRCLGQARRILGDKDAGRADLVRASSELPSLVHLPRETLHAFLEDERCDEAVAFADTLDATVRDDARIRLLRARALVQLGRLDDAEKILLSTPPPADMREGESMADELWFEIQGRREGLLALGEKASQTQKNDFERRYSLPPALDFRMRG